MLSGWTWSGCLVLLYLFFFLLYGPNGLGLVFLHLGDESNNRTSSCNKYLCYINISFLNWMS